MRLGGDEAHVFDHARLFDPTVQLGQRVAAVGPRRSPDDRQHRVAAPPTKLDQRLQSQVHAFESLEATDEEQHGVFALDAQGPAGLRPVARRKKCVLHAEGHDVHARGLGVIEAHELFGLHLTTGEDGIGAGENRRLLEGAVFGLALVEFGLHALEGVEGHDQGDTQLVLETMTGQSTQPVVRVDGVGRPVTAKERRHRVGELGHVIGESFAIERRGRTGRHEVNAKTGLDVDRVAHLSVVATGVDVDVVS